MRTGRHNTEARVPHKKSYISVFVKVPSGIRASDYCWTVTSTMSDISINISFSKNTLTQRSGTANRKRKNKKCNKKNHFLETDRKKPRRAHGEQLSCAQTPLHNGTATKHPSSASNVSSTPSAPTHTLPSWILKHKNPKEPVNTKSATANVGCSASSNHKLTATPGPSALSSDKPAPTMYVSIDCEMVGTGPKGSISQLARCSIVSYEGDVVYDKFINPSMPVTDYRTRWSGIRRSDLIKATPYSQARKEILRLLMGKVVIGHAIHNDFKVLGYSHPASLTRDTSKIPLLNQKAGFSAHECASLKRLTKAIFNRDIQTGRKGHSSVEDARATMELYKVVEKEWERTLAS